MLWIQLRRLNGDDGAARVRAAQVLAQQGNAKAVEPLGEALGDLSWQDRASAAVALGKLGNGRGVAALRNALERDPDVDVRCSAAWGLGEIGGKHVIDSLAAALDDENDAVRRVATEALGKVGTGASIEPLVGALSDPHHDVRLAAVTALGAKGRGAVAEHLLEALEDPEWSVRTTAAEALAKLDDSTALPTLIAALEAGSLAARIAAAESLGRIGDPRGIDPLVAALGAAGYNDPRLRRNVARSLGGIGKAGAIEHLFVLVQDVYTAGVAVESLTRVLTRDARSIDADQLRQLAELDGLEQVPWLIDEAEEAASGVVRVREGRPWRVDATGVRDLADAELRRRDTGS